MTDVLSPEQRRFNMSRIKGRNTKPEKALRSALHRAGWRFRLHRRDLPGCPDIIFSRHKVAVFVDGCFWHGCALHCVAPRTNSDFWAQKIEKNRERDRKAAAILKQLGWKVIRVWEHELKKDAAPSAKAIACILGKRENSA